MRRRARWIAYGALGFLSLKALLAYRQRLAGDIEQVIETDERPMDWQLRRSGD